MYTCMHICMFKYVYMYVISSLSRVWLFCDLHGISQARILEWVAISFSRGSSWPRNWSRVSCIARQILSHRATWEVLFMCMCVNICIYIYIYIWGERASHNCGGQQVQSLQGRPAGRRPREQLLQSWVWGQSGGRILPSGISVFFPLKAFSGSDEVHLHYGELSALLRVYRFKF